MTAIPFGIVGADYPILEDALGMLRGERSQPAEVEGCLYHHPAVQEAAAVGVQDEWRGETVKAFIILKEEASGKVLRRVLRERG